MATRNPSLNNVLDAARKASLATYGSSPNGAEDELLGPRGTWWYTGKAPEQCPGFDSKHNVLRSLPQPNLHTSSRQAVLDYFDNSWTLTEVLFASLQVRAAGVGRIGLLLLTGGVSSGAAAAASVCA